MITICKSMAVTMALVSIFVGTANATSVNRDTSVAAIIKERLANNRDGLKYPASVKRFYQQEGFKLVWLLKDSAKMPAWDAMLLLDCLLQYGLNPADYHPKDFTYRSLNALQTGKGGNNKRAAFDINMTDAIITLINNLHYGKLNPQFPRARIDANNLTEFKADNALADALEWNSLSDMITDVQPQTEAYNNLQRHMLLLTTRFTGLNFITPVTEMRKIAINMERLRWIYTTGKPTQLTCTVREGVLVYSKDVNGLDKKLGMRLYGK